MDSETNLTDGLKNIEPAKTQPMSEDPTLHLTPIQTAALSQGYREYEPYIEVAQICDVGKRQRNEDSSFVFTSQTGGDEPLLPFAFVCVADGMGGHHAGHEASRRVSRMVAQHVMSRIYLPLLKGEAPADTIRDVMLQAVDIANAAIYSPDPEKEGGTTLTAALIVGRRLYVIHVGDSRAYLIHDGQIKQLTTDHSIVKRLEDAGHISAEEAAVHPHRNLLYRAMTGDELEEVDTFTRSLPERGVLLLCSDGLWGALDESEMADILEDEEIPLNIKRDILLQKALDGGSLDNITAVLAQFRL